VCAPQAPRAGGASKQAKGAASTSATSPRASAVTPSTTKAAATPNAYALFVKEHMSTVKMAHPKGVLLVVIIQ